MFFKLIVPFALIASLTAIQLHGQDMKSELDERLPDFHYRIEVVQERYIPNCSENFSAGSCKYTITAFLLGPYGKSEENNNRNSEVRLSLSNKLPARLYNAFNNNNLLDSLKQGCSPENLLNWLDATGNEGSSEQVTVSRLPATLEHCFSIAPRDKIVSHKSYWLLKDRTPIGIIQCAKIAVAPNPHCTVQIYFDQGRYYASFGPVPGTNIFSIVQYLPEFLWAFLDNLPPDIPFQKSAIARNSRMKITPDTRTEMQFYKEILDDSQRIK